MNEPIEMSALRGIVISQGREIEELKSALTAARKVCCENGIGLRKFAMACGVSATRMSEWTSIPTNAAPDIVCRR